MEMKKHDPKDGDIFYTNPFPDPWVMRSLNISWLRREPKKKSEPKTSSIRTFFGCKPGKSNGRVPERGGTKGNLGQLGKPKDSGWEDWVTLRED